ncbi:hypothetical protein MLD38_032258 [Melastoma candidum]|uniref:Uncharacterized protein n=1 Tax=Melastoma candidum TaxID=119954 RepID=A0ACB9M7B5_9MYRT|nr:hypothetical protein MLD38_032258 [Melastoma candidum]
MVWRMVVGILVLALVGVECSATAEKKRAVYIFGDSTADVGTNGFLPGSPFRANFSYYGVDSPELGRTGRFNNGLNTVIISRF